MTKTAELQRAKQLYVEQGMTGSAAAKELGVSLTNLLRWVKRYGWKQMRDERLKAKPEPIRLKRKAFTLTGLQKFTKANFPEQASPLRQLINKYKKA